MFKGVKLSTGQPNSNREVEVGDKDWRSSGKPSSPKDKNILVDQSIIRQPNSTKNMKVKSRRKKMMGETKSNCNYKSLYDNEEKEQNNIQVEEGEIVENSFNEEEDLFQENMVNNLINGEWDDLDNKESMSNVNTSTKILTMEKQAGIQVSSDIDLSDNIHAKEKQSTIKIGRGSVQSVNKNISTPVFYKKNPYDPTKHTISTNRKNPNEIQPSIRNINQQNCSVQNPQILLRWDNCDSTRQYPRGNVNLGIDRSSVVPRIFTRASPSDYRSYYNKSFKQNLSEAKFNRKTKYLVRCICKFISWCVQHQERLSNQDIEDHLWSIGVTNEFFDENDVYHDLLDMIFNSVHSSLNGIPLQRTAVPGNNPNS